MSTDYVSRIERMYERYAPTKLSTVPSILEKFQGREEELIATLVTKYGAEPPSPQQPANAVPAAKRAPPAAAGGNANTDEPEHQQQPSTLAPVPKQQQQQQEGGYLPNPMMDPLYSLRNQVRTQIGFLTKEHELMWEDAWMGKMPLGTLRKTWDVKQSVIMAGTGLKMSSHARPVKRWQRRYFVLAPPFLYYFANDSPTCICKGALYLDRAVVEEETVKERNAIIITSRVTKKPPVLSQGIFSKFGQSSKSSTATADNGGGGDGGSGVASDNINSFMIHFEQEREQATWLDLIRKVVSLGDVGLSGKVYGEYPANPMMMMQQMMAGGRGGGGGGLPPTGGNNMMMDPSNPMFAQMMQQQMMQQQQQQRSPRQQQQGGGNSGGGTMNSNNNPYNWMMGFNNYNVDAPEIKRRIVRLARDRDPILMADVFLQFIQDHMENAGLLWKLMSSLEEVEPYTGPTFQMNGMMGGGPYGGGGMTMGGGGYNPANQQGGGIMRQQQQYPINSNINQMQNSGMNSSFGGAGNLQHHHQGGGMAPSSSSAQQPPMSNDDLDRVSLSNLQDQFSQGGGRSALIRGSSSLRGGGYAAPNSIEELELSVQRQPSSATFQDQQSYQQSHSSRNIGGDDAEWQMRLSRIRDRKQLVDKLVQDLPE